METENIKNGYALSRQWFEFIHNTKEVITPIHTALYFWICELNNQLQWKNIFGLPTAYSMQAIGTKCYKSYKRALDDLIKWGFIELIQKSQNQYTSNQIALVLKTKAQPRQTPKQDQSTADIDKQEETIKTEETIKNNIGEPVIHSEIILYLNSKSEKNFKCNKHNFLLITARAKEGYTLADFQKVIDNKIFDWKNDPEMDKYIRPQTLFGNKFENYLNEKIIPKKQKPQLSTEQNLALMDYNN